ncbi:Tubulin-folding cofactor E-like protein [Drosera capensis]
MRSSPYQELQLPSCVADMLYAILHHTCVSHISGANRIAVLDSVDALNSFPRLTTLTPTMVVVALDILNCIQSNFKFPLLAGFCFVLFSGVCLPTTMPILCLLKDIRLSENPISDPGKGGISRFALIARLAKIKVLNGSEVTLRERKESEIRYVRMVMPRLSDGEDIAKHPR